MIKQTASSLKDKAWKLHALNHPYNVKDNLDPIDLSRSQLSDMNFMVSKNLPNTIKQLERTEKRSKIRKR